MRASSVVLVALTAATLTAFACSSSSEDAATSGDAGGPSSGDASSTSGNGGATTTTGASITIGATGTGGGASCNPACLSGLSCVNGVCQGVIDFETLPGGAPMDGMMIQDQFKASFGVSFGLDTDGDGVPDTAPLLAKVGDPETAFSNDTLGLADTAAPGQDIGMFFLTDDGMVAAPPGPLIITYTSPVDAAYGEIIDIDGDEAWAVDALGESGAVLETKPFAAGDPGTGDGIATPFSFQHPSADIHALVIRYTGTANAAVGLAFDNFSPSSSTPPVK